MCFALYTYHQDEKYRIYYGVNPTLQRNAQESRNIKKWWKYV